jgi:hypothetical protein
VAETPAAPLFLPILYKVIQKLLYRSNKRLGAGRLNVMASAGEIDDLGGWQCIAYQRVRCFSHPAAIGWFGTIDRRSAF